MGSDMFVPCEHKAYRTTVAFTLNWRKLYLTLPDLSLLVPTTLSVGGPPNISRTTEPTATKLCTILGYCMRT